MIPFGQSVTSTSANQPWLLAPLAVIVAVAFGYFASTSVLLMLIAGAGLILLLRWPFLGLPLVFATALLFPYRISTGTAVDLNPTALLVPALFVIWLLVRILRGDLRLVRSRTTLPLLLFLLSLLVSLIIGVATWDPLVPSPSGFILVQFAQWGLFVASALAFLLVGNGISTLKQLRWLTYFGLAFFGVLAMLWSMPPLRTSMQDFVSVAIIRAPFWPLLTAIAAGQLLFNRQLTLRWRLFCIAVLIGIVSYTVVQEVLLRDSATLSAFLGVGMVVAVLAWLRFGRYRWLTALAAVALLISNVFGTVAYEFVGGDAEWITSGGSRLALVERVVEVTLHNPLTGLGPAAYRLYANVEPLVYRHIFWADPRISSHNNYVDIFAHGGILGLALFLWFMVEVFLLAWRLRRRFKGDFAEGYVNSMIAVATAMLAIMLLADWFLPFVYNISFAGFQASVLVWMFLGGLVALEHLTKEPGAAP